MWGGRIKFGGRGESWGRGLDKAFTVRRAGNVNVGDGSNVQFN